MELVWDAVDAAMSLDDIVSEKEVLAATASLEQGPGAQFFFRPAYGNETLDEYADALGTHIALWFGLGWRE